MCEGQEFCCAHACLWPCMLLFPLLLGLCPYSLFLPLLWYLLAQLHRESAGSRAPYSWMASSVFLNWP